MLTKNEIRALTVELNQANVVALLRADAGKPFYGKPAIGRLRELGLIEKGSWSCTEDGRQVVGELVDIPYEPRPSGLEPSATMAKTLAKVAPETSRSSSPNGKFQPRTPDYAYADSTRDSICAQCRVEVPKGSRVIWIQDEGLFHPDCVETS